MYDSGFKYGTLARAIFIGLIGLTPLWWVIAKPTAIFGLMALHVCLLLFLAFGLKPLLLKSGLYQRYSEARHRVGEKRWQRLTEQRRAEVEAAKRRTQIKHSRTRHADLPKNW